MTFVRHSFRVIILAFAGLPALADGPATLAFLHQVEGEWQGAGEVSSMAAGTLTVFGRTLLTRK